MNATKKLAGALLFLVSASILSIGALIKERKASIADNGQKADLVLYYGDSCPHCKIVEEYIKNNDPSGKIIINRKEVWSSQDNQKDFLEKATACGLDLNNLGVPMLYDAVNSKCYEGDQTIIDFLDAKLPKN